MLRISTIRGNPLYYRNLIAQEEDPDIPEEPAKVYGVSWDKAATSTLTRTDDAVGMVAAAGVDSGMVTNDFDTADIYKDITDVTDTLGNEFVRIPKFYIKKTDGTGYKTWQISLSKGDGYYLPWCFWDFTNSVELPYVYVGKYTASLNGTKLASVSGTYPKVLDNIVNFRTYAENNNVDGLLGYQQMDVHVYDMLQTLFYVEFATLNCQSIMRGFADGRYVGTDVLVADTSPAGNTLIVSNAVGAYYAVGQAISVGTSLGGNQRFYGRTITDIDADTPVAGQTTITFDGDAVALVTNDILYNTGMKSGFSSAIAATSGSISSNSDGKHSFVYRGIESLYADVWQFVDGVNINERQAWVCRDADDYASNLFASPYIQLSYVNHTVNGYPTTLGFDTDEPYAAFPTAIGGDGSNYYADYYYQSTGQRIALVGGWWGSLALAGLSSWLLSYNSSAASVYFGARLLKKAL